jgi:hypothetical protein
MEPIDHETRRHEQEKVTLQNKTLTLQRTLLLVR